ncbi:hypothetical protein, partial [Burkholderia pseudomallei]|uniref:hypothetical protein n=2 Tax=Burkholderia pseudomallei TaxID=28450 RepID=UPI001C4C1776
FAVCGLRFAVCGLRFAVCGLRFAVCDHRPFPSTFAIAAWHSPLTVWRFVFGVWRLAFGVWRLAFGVWRLAFGVWRNEYYRFERSSNRMPPSAPVRIFVGEAVKWVIPRAMRDRYTFAANAARPRNAKRAGRAAGA